MCKEEHEDPVPVHDASMGTDLVVIQSRVMDDKFSSWFVSATPQQRGHVR